jgi:hypothetical protein
MSDKDVRPEDPRNASKLERWTESVDAELYDELLNRYERVLVFAGQLQEKLKGQRLLQEKNENLEDENQRLRRVVSAGEAYMRVLEKALEAVGLPESPSRDANDSNLGN